MRRCILEVLPYGHHHKHSKRCTQGGGSGSANARSRSAVLQPRSQRARYIVAKVDAHRWQGRKWQAGGGNVHEKVLSPVSHWQQVDSHRQEAAFAITPCHSACLAGKVATGFGTPVPGANFGCDTARRAADPANTEHNKVYSTERQHQHRSNEQPQGRAVPSPVISLATCTADSAQTSSPADLEAAGSIW